ncbi:hypothetical protein [Paenibacillus agilis]|uniref:Uncharacterized protein n=1 Tax=Paenibacillus agilis TaxID=3020863 RepID=A0A559J144_9BACL|nr:hypothetical protein [Paenibacillus agilis]TVX93573.1 hypothetical protein FPZ44_11210 [Paenibacillus agilis]
MNHKPLYLKAINSIAHMEEILKCNKVVILGTGYSGRVIGYMISESLKNGCFESELTDICYLERTQLSRSCEDLLYPVIHEIPVNNEESILITADEFQVMDRDVVKIYRSGFKKIIDGTSLANCGYHPVFFNIGDIGTKNLDLQVVAKKFDKQLELEGIPTSLAEVLSRRPDDKDVIIKMVETYHQHGKELLAKDYCNRIQKRENETVRSQQCEKLITDPPEADEECPLTIIDSMEKALSLNYLGRSGSIYFGSLLDSHDEIIVLPPGILYDPFPYLYTQFISRKAEVTLDQLMSCFSFNQPLFGNYDEWIKMKYSDGNKFYDDDYNNHFVSIMKRVLSLKIKQSKGFVSEKFLIKAMYYAHHKVSGKEQIFKKRVPYILNQFHTSDAMSIKKFSALFPTTVILMTIRNIIQSMGSAMAALQRENKGELHGRSVINLLYYFSENIILRELSKTNRVILVQIENLNICPVDTMRDIVKKLCIDWQDCLLQSTILGRTLYDGYVDTSNVQYENGPRLTGISKHYDEYFNPFDRYRLESLFLPLLKQWGYTVKERRDDNDWEELSKIPFKFEEYLAISSDKCHIFREQFSKAYCKVMDELKLEPDYLKRLELALGDIS